MTWQATSGGPYMEEVVLAVERMEWEDRSSGVAVTPAAPAAAATPAPAAAAQTPRTVVGPARYCSPSHRSPFDSTNKGPNACR
jgi:hypothetical protein